MKENYNRFFIQKTDYEWTEVSEEVIDNPDPKLFIENKAFVRTKEDGSSLMDIEVYNMSMGDVKDLLDCISSKSNNILQYVDANQANNFNPNWFDLFWNSEHTRFIAVLKDTVSYVTEF